MRRLSLLGVVATSRTVRAEEGDRRREREG